MLTKMLTYSKLSACQHVQSAEQNNEGIKEIFDEKENKEKNYE